MPNERKLRARSMISQLCLKRRWKVNCGEGRGLKSPQSLTSLAVKGDVGADQMIRLCKNFFLGMQTVIGLQQSRYSYIWNWRSCHPFKFRPDTIFFFLFCWISYHFLPWLWGIWALKVYYLFILFPQEQGTLWWKLEQELLHSVVRVDFLPLE